MKNLLDSFEADFDDAEGWIRIVDADWFSDDLKLNLSIQFHDDRDPELWEIACTGVVEESLSSYPTESLSVSSNSPLLAPFMEPEVQIMFSKNLVAPQALFGIICSCCIEVIGRPERISRFLNGTPSVNGISSSQYGLLGRFPESLAARILADLKDKPINAIALPGCIPKHWNGVEQVPYQQLEALEIGVSYVIARQFSACRV